jgi:deoxyribonuclease V
MKQALQHRWRLTEAEAEEFQRSQSGRVIRVNDDPQVINKIAGVDVAYDKHSDQLIAAVVVLDAQSLAIVDQASAEDEVQFPYIPGLFSFRELPPIAKALAKLQTQPDLIVCDGQGIAHPRRFGLACHVGVLFDVPTIGCGKSSLQGKHEAFGLNRGESLDIIDGDEVIGRALRTQTGINPLYVSIGHRISLGTACEWILKLTPQYRLPETTRAADGLVNKLLAERQT